MGSSPGENVPGTVKVRAIAKINRDNLFRFFLRIKHAEHTIVCCYKKLFTLLHNQVWLFWQGFFIYQNKVHATGRKVVVGITEDESRLGNVECLNLMGYVHNFRVRQFAVQNAFKGGNIMVFYPII